MYLYSRIRLFSPTDGHLHGGLLPGAQEIPVLYKAEGFAPLGRRPAVHRDASLTRASIDRLAHPCADLVWDPRSRLFWFLGGNVDRTPDDRWIRGREVYRYDAEGRYRGSLVLPFVAVALAAGGDGSLWAIDSAGRASTLAHSIGDSGEPRGLSFALGGSARPSRRARRSVKTREALARRDS